MKTYNNFLFLLCHRLRAAIRENGVFFFIWWSAIKIESSDQRKFVLVASTTRTVCFSMWHQHQQLCVCFSLFSVFQSVVCVALSLSGARLKVSSLKMISFQEREKQIERNNRRQNIIIATFLPTNEHFWATETLSWLAPLKMNYISLKYFSFLQHWILFTIRKHICNS